ncbi:glycosyltransferase [Sphingomonas gilva]|uniref:Glycosyltransferase n=2 Tax=Sphingomonas gilva TaxID=2305907 RepID=A0A396RPU2_9SPHN|nr:glycosyltransferase [Sphingomonas gilva]
MTIAATILTYAESLAGGGVERAQLELARQWIDAGRRVVLVIGSAEGPLGREIPAGMELIELGSDRYPALLALPRHVRKVAPDVIFCPGNYYTGVAAVTRLRLGRACPPVVAKVSNAFARADQGPLAAWGYRWWLRRHPAFIDRFVAMGAAMREEAIRVARLDPAVVDVVADPLPQAPPSGSAPPLPGAPFVLGVGRLNPQKRWDRLIESVSRLPDLHLVILGDGPERLRLEALATRLGVTARVHLPGHSGDPLAAMRAARVVALTSDFEGIPAVLREALSVGTPVVTTDSAVSIRDVVGPHQGSIVPIGDAAALDAALTRWSAPGTARPQPFRDGDDAGVRYLTIFDSVVEGGRLA